LGSRSTIDGASYTLDAAGNRTAKVNDLSGLPAGQAGGATTNFGYDAIYELLNATQGGNTTESYSYDPVGNRLSSLGVASYSYNVSNEMTSNSNSSYTYDNNGNTLTKVVGSNTTSYAWDLENRLTSVTLPGTGGTVQFKYDPFGRRIEKISPNATSIFAYDGDNLVETVNGSGGVVARYTDGWNIDEPLAESRSGTVSYYEQDGVGSVTSLSNTAGALAQTYTYDSFGNITNSSGSLTNFLRYAGRDFDTETGLYFDRARYFDPTSGRFLSEDPKQFAADVNFYRYVWNNPVDFSDPLGLQGGGNANTWTFGEVGKWAWLPTPGYPPPPGLGDVKASIGAACALNGGGCNAVDGSTKTDPIDQAAWNNITNASGTDRSGGGNYMCVNGQGCQIVHKCTKCINGKPTLVNRPQPLQPSGTVTIQGHTVYFYYDPLLGWCDAADKRSGCKCK